MDSVIDSDKSLIYRQLKLENPDKTIVACCGGAFDLIHYGYTVTFKEACRHCDKFIIFLQRDPSETRYTKYKPVVPYYERYETLMSIKYIDEVYMYQTEEELYDLMKFFSPDVRILGEDYIGKPFTGDDLPHKVIYTTRSHERSTTYIKQLITIQTLKQSPELLDSPELAAIFKEV